MKKLLSFLFIIALSNANAQESYYNNVDLNLTGVSLKNALATKIINTHTGNLSYSQVWDASKVTDVNPTNSAEVLLIYGYSSSGQTSRTRGINDNGGSVGQWSREHTFANSLANPDLDQSGSNSLPYTDAHNLRPADVQRNSTRSNRKFGTGSGTASENSSDANGDGRQAWYPGDEWKGDVARIAMYMYLRYGDQCKPTFLGVGNNSSTPDDMIDLFLQWNADDPVSDVEKQRNPYHENTSNSAAQGNRNPFIDNPRLATRIWGGPEAEDRWGIYTSTDTVAPSIPTNLIVSNETTSTLDLNWTASTDNDSGVTSYDVYVDGNLLTSVTTNSYTITNLSSNTTYSLSVLARDAANNTSAQSSPINGTTLADTQAPTIPTNVVVSNQTDTTFKVTWSASTDNTAITSYDIYLDGSLHGNATNTEYVAMGLTATTTYVVTVLAKDAVNNMSAQSSPVNGTTTDGSGSGATELFFSEYVEGSSNNKALEIANVTGQPIDLSIYSIKRNGNGASTWSGTLNLSGTIQPNDVYVIINGSAAIQTLIDQADFVQPNNSSTNNGAPINFNGNDPVGLFKNNVLIDIIGVFGNSANFAKDRTLRRKNAVVSPNTTYTLSEWEEFPQNTVDNIGVVNSGVLSIDTFTDGSFTLYPNPTKGNKIFFTINENFKVEIFSILGKSIVKKEVLSTENEIDISNLKNGIYLIKFTKDKKSITKKFVKN